MSKRPNRMKRDALSRKAKRVAQAEAKKDVDPRFVWVRPTPEIGPDKFRVCYRLGDDQPTVVARDVITATPAEWRKYVRFQSQFSRRPPTQYLKNGSRRSLASVAVEAASKQAGMRIKREDVWVIPAFGLRDNRYRICYLDAWTRSPEMVSHTVTVSEAMWAAFCEDQERFDPGFRERVEAATAARAR